MIARVWHGWTTHQNARAYEEVFRTKVLPEVNAVEGCTGAYLLRRDLKDEAEFVALTLFESIKAVQGFAGEDHELAVITPEAKEALKHYEERATHYEIVFGPN